MMDYKETVTALLGPKIAPQVVEKFPTARSLALAAEDELTVIRGLGAFSCGQIRAAVRLGDLLTAYDPTEKRAIRSPADAANLLLHKMSLFEQEYLYVVLLNTRNVVIGEPVEVYHGSLNTSLIRVGEIFRPAVRANAAAIIVLHNHPSGDPSPSPEDVAVTRAIVEAGKLLDIELLDHLVIGLNNFVSLKERGLGF